MDFLTTFAEARQTDAFWDYRRGHVATWVSGNWLSLATEGIAGSASVWCCWAYRLVCMLMSVTNCMKSEMRKVLLSAANISDQRAVHPSSARGLSHCLQRC